MKWSFFYIIYTFFVWIQHGCLVNTVRDLDPKNSVIKWLWCTAFTCKYKCIYIYIPLAVTEFCKDLALWIWKENLWLECKNKQDEMMNKEVWSELYFTKWDWGHMLIVKSQISMHTSQLCIGTYSKWKSILPSWKGVYSKRKEFAPKGSTKFALKENKLFPSRVDLFSEGAKTFLTVLQTPITFFNTVDRYRYLCKQFRSRWDGL